MGEAGRDAPLVSVVITVYNGEKYVEQCIRSVLAQTYSNFEVIVADDASTDDSLAVIASFDDSRIRILPGADGRLGLHGNWARAYEHATGRYLKHVCHDDLVAPDCLAIQVDLLEAHPEAALAGGRRQIIDARGSTVIAARGLGSLNTTSTPRVVAGVLVARACVKAGTNLLGEPATVLVRRSMLPTPIFYPEWSYTIDIEFYLRVIASSSAVLDRRVVSSFRVSTTQLSAELSKSQARELRELFIELRRQHPNSIRARDVVEGSLRSLAHAQARRVLYSFLRLRRFSRGGTRLTRQREQTCRS